MMTQTVVVGREREREGIEKGARMPREAGKGINLESLERNEGKKGF